jgi:hypothetical protein
VSRKSRLHTHESHFFRGLGPSLRCTRASTTRRAIKGGDGKRLAYRPLMWSVTANGERFATCSGYFVLLAVFEIARFRGDSRLTLPTISSCGL